MKLIRPCAKDSNRLKTVRQTEYGTFMHQMPDSWVLNSDKQVVVEASKVVLKHQFRNEWSNIASGTLLSIESLNQEVVVEASNLL